MAKNRNRLYSKGREGKFPHEQVVEDFDRLIGGQPWSRPGRKVFGLEVSTRERRFSHPTTKSTVELLEMQPRRFLFGVPIALGEPTRQVKWTVRESAQPSLPCAVVTYREEARSTEVDAQYFYDASGAPLTDTADLMYFNGLPNIYPSPDFKHEEWVAEMLWLLKQQIPTPYAPL